MYVEVGGIDGTRKWAGIALVVALAAFVAFAAACSDDDGVGNDDDPDVGAGDVGSEDDADTSPGDAGGEDAGDDGDGGVEDAGEEDAGAEDAGGDADAGNGFEPSEGMAFVPGGSYVRGCDDDVHDCSILEWAQPAHEVYVSPFEIDERPVTEAEYDECVTAGVCEEPNHDAFYDGSGDEYPVVNVSSEQAMTYCEWRNKRLPTEAEWEKAARGDDERIYPWGDEEPNCDAANYDECQGEIEPVGQRPYAVSPYGVEDMAGNVRNWTQDWFDGDYYQESPTEDPQGPDSGETRTVRGASFFSGESALPVWTRHGMEQPGWSHETGFRCAR